jgi:hypothetical protein
MMDLLETFYQLKEAGQIGEEYFFAFVDYLIKTVDEDIKDEDIKSMRQQIVNMITTLEENDVDNMLEKYYNESFKLSHRVLLVSHSQGNLVANRVYDSISPSGYQNYFANVQIASPASSVHASHGTYITGWIDPVINPIPGSMESNADLNFPGGHAFVEAYLDSSDAYIKIVEAIKTQLDVLDTIDSQWKIIKEPNHCDSCDALTVKVRHLFDSSVKLEEKVLPYLTDNFKLYSIKDRYVIASCGGTKILDTWET